MVRSSAAKYSPLPPISLSSSFPMKKGSDWNFRNFWSITCLGRALGKILLGNCHLLFRKKGFENLRSKMGISNRFWISYPLIEDGLRTKYICFPLTRLIPVQRKGSISSLYIPINILAFLVDALPLRIIREISVHEQAPSDITVLPCCCCRRARWTSSSGHSHNGIPSCVLYQFASVHFWTKRQTCPKHW